MRIYRLKHNLNMSDTDQPSYIYKGTMFYVDSQMDLPDYTDSMDPRHKEYWQELELFNNYGTVKLVGKI